MMPPPLVLLALGTLASEDLACAGVLVAQGQVGFLEATLACLAGIFCGDMLLFLFGSAAGSYPGFRRWMNRWAPPDKIQAATDWLSHKGLSVVVISRFTPGLRLPTYLAAGLLRSRVLPFCGYFLLAASAWTPILVGGTALFGEQALRNGWIKNSPASVLAIFAIFGFGKHFSQYENRRLLVGFLRRKLGWEFWPMWAAYLPLLPYFLYLTVRHRSIAVFTAANPGIPSGGLVGESKSAILRHLSKERESVPAFTVASNAESALGFVEDSFPVVLKPDVGERGQGVSIVRSEQELREYFQKTDEPVIVQRYVPGVEFGVFYKRFPNEENGQITSITEKRFPLLTGDGRSSLWQLILRDRRAIAMAGVYKKLCQRPIHSIPALGEQVQLVEIGSHCRGAIFLDGGHLRTENLERAINRLSKAHPGFYLGRFDLRAASVEEFRQGKFQVIELNGVSSESTHIYDPAVSIWEAYRVMAAQWRDAFAIGAMNRARGFRSMTAIELAELLLPSRTSKMARLILGIWWLRDLSRPA